MVVPKSGEVSSKCEVPRKIGFLAPLVGKKNPSKRGARLPFDVGSLAGLAGCLEAPNMSSAGFEASSLRIDGFDGTKQILGNQKKVEV